MDIIINGKSLSIEMKQPRPAASERLRPINVTLSKSDIARLDALKKQTGTSRSALFRCAIKALEIAVKDAK
jgi:L-alanine-DL-glutamate epimerase-like enolase superfamily enzyme